MGFRFLSAVVMAASIVLSGCSVLHNHYAKVGSGPSASADQAQSWKAEIHPDPGGGPPVFEPIARAGRAITQANATRGVEPSALNEARDAIKNARDQWSAITDYDDIDAAQLEPIATNAHKARRLAEIARYNALDRTNTSALARLGKGASATRLPAQSQSAGEVIVPGAMGQIVFQQDTARATTATRRVIGKLAAYLQQSDHSASHVGIAGRTATISPSDDQVTAFIRANPRVKKRAKTGAQKRRAYQQALAITRARDVAELLARAGVSQSRIGVGIAQTDEVSGQASGDVVVELIHRPDDNGS